MPKAKEPLSIGFLYDDTLDSPDGVAQYVKTLGAWLSQRGHKVSYLVGETKMNNWRGGEVFSLARNIRLSWGGNRLSIPLFAKRGKIKEVLQAGKFDILHVQVPYSPLMSQVVIKRAHPDTVVMGTLHVFTTSVISRIGSKLLKLWYGKSLRRFDRMLSVSRAAQSYAKATLSQTSDIIPNMVEIAHFNQHKTRKKAGPKKIVFLGRLVERKGCEYLLRAFKQAFGQSAEVRLIIAGDGPQRQKLEKLARSLGIGSKVDFLGYVSETQKIKLLLEADIACFPSLYGESFGIVLIEAMAAGAKVVLGGDNPGYTAVLGAQPDLLIDPKDTIAFAGRLQKLIQDDRLRRQIHRWQLEEVKKYDTAVVGPTIETVYYQAIAKRRQSRHN